MYGITISRRQVMGVDDLGHLGVGGQGSLKVRVRFSERVYRTFLMLARWLRGPSECEPNLNATKDGETIRHPR